MRKASRSLLFAFFVFMNVSAAAAAENILKVRLLSDVSTLDPQKLRQISDTTVAGNVYNHLVTYTPGAVTIEPDLATSWNISPDGKVYTFNLRRGVKWHKGFGEFTARDVKYSIERIRDPKTRSPHGSDFEPVDKVEVVDDYTVRISLNTPFAPFLTGILAYRGGWLVNQAAVEKFGPEYGLNPIGTGPFMFERYTPGVEVVLSANKDYYGGPPKLEKIVFKPIAEETMAEIALEKGDIDIMYFRDAEVYKRLKAKKGIVVEEKIGLGAYLLVFNSDKKPFNDARVRKAICHAINKDQIAIILGGIAVRADNVLPPNFFSYTEDVTRYEYSLEKARKLLTEAGFGGGFKTTLNYSQLSPWPSIVPVIQDQLKKVNIDVELKGLEHASHLLFLYAKKHAFAVQPMVRPPDPDLIFHYSLHSKGAYNAAQYRAADEEIEKARTEMSPDKRKAIYIQLQKKVMGDAPNIPLFHLKVLLARRPYVKGHPVDLLNGFWGHSTYIEK